jgi:uncharacterized CHY-type Zn-finger protein
MSFWDSYSISPIGKIFFGWLAADILMDYAANQQNQNAPYSPMTDFHPTTAKCPDCHKVLSLDSNDKSITWDCPFCNCRFNLI